MNIFATSPDPVLSAAALDDRRMAKMVLETAQIMCSALHRVLHPRHHDDIPYRPTHIGHPCVVWAAHSRLNFLWLHSHGRALADQFLLRHQKEHKSRAVISRCASIAEQHQPWPAERTALTPHPNVTTITNDLDVHRCYRSYLEIKWRQDTPPNPRWTRTTPPAWYTGSAT